MTRTGVLGAFVAAVAVGASGPEARAQAPSPEAVELAARLLNDASPVADREALIKENPALSADLVAAMAEGLGNDDKEEYRRIPWIWRVAIAAGRRNETGELLGLLERSVPVEGSRLDDWQAVVIGGGLINGITQAGAWPGPRIADLVHEKPELAARWRRAIDLASVMADDPAVPTGTRYDALRMLGAESWERRGAQLFRYLAKGTHPELQMGAVSGLGDVSSPVTGQALLSGIAHYNETNRNLALDALLRDDGRALALLDALADGRVSRAALGDRRAQALTGHPGEAVRKRAAEVLVKPEG